MIHRDVFPVIIPIFIGMEIGTRLLFMSNSGTPSVPQRSLVKRTRTITKAHRVTREIGSETPRKRGGNNPNGRGGGKICFQCADAKKGVSQLSKKVHLEVFLQ